MDEAYLRQLTERIREDRIALLRQGEPGRTALIEGMYADFVALAQEIEDPERRQAELEEATQMLDDALEKLIQDRIRDALIKEAEEE
jgi:protein-tyrosine-phosphatase